MKEAKAVKPGEKPPGMIRFVLKQKSVKTDGSKPRKIEELFGQRNTDESVYKDFVKRISERKKKELLEQELNRD